MGCTQSKTSCHFPAEASTAAVENHVGLSVTEAKAELIKNETVVVVSPSVNVKKTPDFAFKFVPGEVSTNEYGIAFYNFDGYNPANPSQEVHVCKRYSEFKRMYAKISELVASEENVKVEDKVTFQAYPALPSMPRANVVTFVLGRGNQDVVKEREAQFVKILNAIAAHPIAFQSKPFTDFIA
ncbi:unnamed protein product [Peronospora belbahrii]|uniref:PX domain-containing protein n=1 Tax=Peronospora belbahrii TaxID=622444 RepID=A0AAU9L4Q8_9STRA|nr:unnamed protein product [Peronospora belbahrii]CAH0522374.1 unnamed protein product [Peronospora belbahrii]